MVDPYLRPRMYLYVFIIICSHCPTQAIKQHSDQASGSHLDLIRAPLICMVLNILTQCPLHPCQHRKRQEQSALEFQKAMYALVTTGSQTPAAVAMDGACTPHNPQVNPSMDTAVGAVAEGAGATDAVAVFKGDAVAKGGGASSAPKGILKKAVSGHPLNLTCMACLWCGTAVHGSPGP